jgi:raffinose/stachyose/melibiose transport system substrate-binding protein
MMKKKKFSLFVSILMILMLVLAACSNGSSAPTGGSSAPTGGDKSAGDPTPKPTDEVKPPVESDKEWVIKFDPQGHLPKKPDAQDPREKRALDDLNKEYEALHPNIKIELVKVPSTQDRNAWMQARMMAKDAPDVFWLNFESTWENYQKGWFYALDDWMKMPNPYNEDKIWGETFVPGILDSVRAPNGKLYDIPADSVGITIFYNKKIFQDLNLQEPKTWKEFMDIQAKIKDSGTTPFAFMHVSKGCCDVSWSEQMLHSQFLNGNLDELDKDKNNRVDPIEIAQATKNGLMPNMDILKQEILLLKEWSQYWPKGFMGKYDQPQMFATGKAAMIYGSSGGISYYNKMNLPFELGMFNFPIVTKESASLSAEKGAKILGAWGAGQWVVPGYLEQEDPEKLAIIRDYLMFLSKPDNISKIEMESALEPNIIGAKPLAGHEVFQENLPITVIQGYDVYMGKTFADIWENGFIQYLSGSMDLDGFLKEIKKAYDQGADEIIAQQAQSEKK